MSLPSLLFILRGSIADTFAQARSAGLLWGLLAITAACTLFCLGVSIVGETPQLETKPWEYRELVPTEEAARKNLTPTEARSEGVDVPSGEIRILFGAVRIPLRRTGAETVRFIELMLAGGVADTAGILLCLMWTAGFLPAFLQPTSASVLFAKPVSRGAVLLSKMLGVCVVVGSQAVIFVGATWLALGLRTGMWDTRYFLAVPILLVHFAIFFSFSAMLATVTRSAVASALATLLIWLLCFSINLVQRDRIARQTVETPCRSLEVAYCILPKPLDYNLLLADLMDAEPTSSDVTARQEHDSTGEISTELSLMTGVGFAAAMCLIAAKKLKSRDV